MADVVLQSELPLPLLARGKVRDIYAVGDDRLLHVASDRLSAFDVVFNEGIPGKGRILTALSAHWARSLPSCQPYHLITDDIDEMDIELGPAREALRGRTQLVERLTMLPVECVIRGYLMGSGWKDYCATGKVCGHELPTGMQKGDRLPTPIFTPATKAEDGDHDENISYDAVVAAVGELRAQELQSRALAVYTEASSSAYERGLILVDTKLEFGTRADGTLVLGDEILTPDSSRYWDKEEAQSAPAGTTAKSYDKQVVRDYLETLDWDKTPPPPTLPAEVVARAAARYEELASRLGIHLASD